jgi:predicted amidohydrolase
MDGRKEFLQYHKAAIEVPSEATNQIEAIASKHDILLVVGVIEQELGTLYCTAIFVHPVKGLIGKHRKIMPTAAEKLVWGFGDGSTLPVLEEAFRIKGSQDETNVKICATICW